MQSRQPFQIAREGLVKPRFFPFGRLVKKPAAPGVRVRLDTAEPATQMIRHHLRFCVASFQVLTLGEALLNNRCGSGCDTIYWRTDTRWWNPVSIEICLACHVLFGQIMLEVAQAAKFRAAKFPAMVRARGVRSDNCPKSGASGCEARQIY
jgi:hypothetical protein